MLGACALVVAVVRPSADGAGGGEVSGQGGGHCGRRAGTEPGHLGGGRAAAHLRQRHHSHPLRRHHQVRRATKVPHSSFHFTILFILSVWISSSSSMKTHLAPRYILTKCDLFLKIGL